MPHKHKRRDKDESIYDLPPSVIAKPLPVRDPNAKPNHKNKNKKHKNRNKNPSTTTTPSTTAKNANPSNKASDAHRKAGANEDDTPKAFRRLMQLHAQRTQPKSTIPPTEEEEDPLPTTNTKKRKRDATERPISQKKAAAAQAIAAVAAQSITDETKKPVAIPKILPGEKLSDFAARVDREMPMSKMNRSSKVDTSDLPKIREHRQTKHEKHLRRLQEQWRKDEKEILEREQAEKEEREGEMEEELRLWNQWEMEAGKGKAKKKGSGKRKGGVDLVESDPWAKLNKARMNKPVNPLEVAQAPPELKKPREIFKVRGGAKVDVANVPAAGGSLRQREELATERKNIVEQYRKMMAEKRGL